MENGKINKAKNINALHKDSDEVTTPLNNSTANPVKQQNIQEADQQPQVPISTRNHLKKENEFADSGTDDNESVKVDKPAPGTNKNSTSNKKENKNISKGYL
ncbi:hypothetical protein [Ferruginibacter sp.]